MEKLVVVTIFTFRHGTHIRTQNRQVASNTSTYSPVPYARRFGACTSDRVRVGLNFHVCFGVEFSYLYYIETFYNGWNRFQSLPIASAK